MTKAQQIKLDNQGFFITKRKAGDNYEVTYIDENGNITTEGAFKKQRIPFVEFLLTYINIGRGKSVSLNSQTTGLIENRLSQGVNIWQWFYSLLENPSHDGLDLFFHVKDSEIQNKISAVNNYKKPTEMTTIDYLKAGLSEYRESKSSNNLAQYLKKAYCLMKGISIYDYTIDNIPYAILYYKIEKEFDDIKALDNLEWFLNNLILIDNVICFLPYDWNMLK
ncbi:MAG: hypothetical protein WDK95_06710 [Syntrophorhabdaceae bacterium]